jgi:hypothetical protein
MSDIGADLVAITWIHSVDILQQAVPAGSSALLPGMVLSEPTAFSVTLSARRSVINRESYYSE